MQTNDIYCDFVPIGNHKLYKCDKCGFIVQLRDIYKKYVCRIKLQQQSKSTDNPMNVKLIKTERIPVPQQQIKSKKVCSQQQIDDRLSICKTCQYYKNNTCLQCGCSLSRDQVFMNKLYWPDQSCPIGKWGPVEAESAE